MRPYGRSMNLKLSGFMQLVMQVIHMLRSTLVAVLPIVMALVIQALFWVIQT